MHCKCFFSFFAELSVFIGCLQGAEDNGAAVMCVLQSNHTWYFDGTILSEITVINNKQKNNVAVDSQ